MRYVHLVLNKSLLKLTIFKMMNVHISTILPDESAVRIWEQNIEKLRFLGKRNYGK